MYQKRLQKITALMENENIFQMLLTSSSNLFYLTGVSFDSGERFTALLLSREQAPLFFCNSLFPQGEKSPFDVVWHEDGSDPLVSVIEKLNPQYPLAVDKDCPARFLFSLLKQSFHLSDASSVIDRARMIKDNHEIRLLREASGINDKALHFLTEQFRPDITEKELMRALELFYNRHDSVFSFMPLIAFGSHAAVPHHKTGNTLPETSGSVLFDIGGRTRGYCSDMTRTFSFGAPAPLLKEIHAITLEANTVAEEMIRPGVLFRDIDLTARNIIEKYGYGEYFTHRTGHNIGIDVHEYPDVSRTNAMPVEAGMAFSVEPGIYIPGHCGVRIEDLVIVTETGAEILNKYPKDLKEF